jgi:outer membrane protein TolC
VCEDLVQDRVSELVEAVRKSLASRSSTDDEARAAARIVPALFITLGGNNEAAYQELRSVLEVLAEGASSEETKAQVRPMLDRTLGILPPIVASVHHLPSRVTSEQ